MEIPPRIAAATIILCSIPFETAMNLPIGWNHTMNHGLCRIAIAALLVAASASTALAVPPSYVLLRRAEGPGPQHMPGKPPAYMQPTRAYGYAYGWFGAAPRAHASRSFGYYREYTQWSVR